MAYSGEGSLIEGQVEGDPNKTVIPVAVDADGHLIIDLDASTITIGKVDQGSAGTDPWTVKIDQTGTNNNVNANVTNFPATQIISGAVTESNVDRNFGTWAYYGGVSGTINVAAGQRVLSISCHSSAGGTLQINGGQIIPVPANVGFAINPLGNLVAPTVVYSGTDSYFIEVVS